MIFAMPTSKWQHIGFRVSMYRLQNSMDIQSVHFRTATKKCFAVYLKFTFNWVFRSLAGQSSFGVEGRFEFRLAKQVLYHLSHAPSPFFFFLL
jgi:hypothetical protein